jgi:hypothetical protein
LKELLVTVDISRLDDVAEPLDPRLAFGGPNQISIHLFDCHGGEGPAQHLASVTVPDYSPWDSAWVQPGPYEVAAIMWNFKAAIYAMRPQEDVLLACLTLVGRDDPMPVHRSESHASFDPIWATFERIEAEHCDPELPVDVLGWAARDWAHG